MSLVIDPDHTLPADAVVTLEAALSRAPSVPAIIMFVESRGARYVHDLIDRVAASTAAAAVGTAAVPSVDAFFARLRPIVRAAAMRLPYQTGVHPFRPTLTSSRAELQLLGTAPPAAGGPAVMARAIRILVAFNERRIRAEVPSEAGVSTALVRSQLRAAVSRLHEVEATEGAMREVLATRIADAFRILQAANTANRYAKRFIIGLALAVIGFFAVRWLLRLYRSSSVLKRRLLPRPSQQDATCCICLRGTDSSSSSSSSEDDADTTAAAPPRVRSEPQHQRPTSSRKLWLRLECGHEMHADCVRAWFVDSSHHSCPMCRSADYDLALALRGSNPLQHLGAYARTLMQRAADHPEGRLIAANALLHVMPVLARVLYAMYVSRKTGASLALFAAGGGVSASNVVEITF